jgi:hypothetical protein
LLPSTAHSIPGSLVKVLSGDIPTAVIEALSEQCVEVGGNEDLRWALTPDARATIFSRLHQAGRLQLAATFAMTTNTDATGSSLARAGPGA